MRARARASVSARATFDVERARRELMRRVVPLVDRCTETVREEVVAVIDEGPHTGREYRQPDGTTYRASAPGEPPASPTGIYPASWGTSPARIVGQKVRGTAYTTSGIAPKLEYGDAGPPQIEPRPHASVAMQRAAPRIRELLAQASRRP